MVRAVSDMDAYCDGLGSLSISINITDQQAMNKMNFILLTVFFLFFFGGKRSYSTRALPAAFRTPIACIHSRLSYSTCDDIIVRSRNVARRTHQLFAHGSTEKGALSAGLFWSELKNANKNTSTASAALLEQQRLRPHAPSIDWLKSV